MKKILNISLIIFLISFQLKSFAGEKNYHKELITDWSRIFPDKNRNAAGPKFFKYISDKYTNFEEFQEYNKLYCAVSGSLISPGSKPEFINLKEDETSKNICGYYYKCCWPCVCDVMKYAKVTKIKKKFQDGAKDLYALIIDNPCMKKDFPKKVNRSYFCDGNILDKKQVATHNDKLIIGLLYDAKYCQPSDLRKIYSNKITGRLCPIRNSTPINELSSGMGDIFIKLAR